MKTLAEFEYGESYPVTWEFDGQAHKITYGCQTKAFDCGLAASREFGECVRHSLECAGALNMENYK